MLHICLEVPELTVVCLLELAFAEKTADGFGRFGCCGDVLDEENAVSVDGSEGVEEAGGRGGEVGVGDGWR